MNAQYRYLHFQYNNSFDRIHRGDESGIRVQLFLNSTTPALWAFITYFLLDFTPPYTVTSPGLSSSSPQLSGLPACHPSNNHLTTTTTNQRQPTDHGRLCQVRSSSSAASAPSRAVCTARWTHPSHQGNPVALSNPVLDGSSSAGHADTREQSRD